MPEAPLTHRRPVRAPRLGTSQSAPRWAPEAVRRGETAARGRSRSPGGDWSGPLGTAGTGGGRYFNHRPPPGALSRSISRSKSRRKILKKIPHTEQEMSKQLTKFHFHPRFVEGEIKSRKSGGGVDGRYFKYRPPPCVLVFQFVRSQTEIQKI